MENNDFITRKNFIIIVIAVLLIFVIFISVLSNSVKGKQEVLVQDISKLKQIQEQTQVQAEIKNTKAETKASYLTQSQVKDFFNSKISVIHPVGNILITVDSRNPGEYIPGTTWEAWGQGRMILGVGSQKANTYTGHGTVAAGNTNHTSAEILGGSHLATAPAHTHVIDDVNSKSAGAHTHTAYYYGANHRGKNGTKRNSIVSPTFSEAKTRYSPATTENLDRWSYSFS